MQLILQGLLVVFLYIAGDKAVYHVKLAPILSPTWFPLIALLLQLSQDLVPETFISQTVLLMSVFLCHHPAPNGHLSRESFHVGFGRFFCET